MTPGVLEQALCSPAVCAAVLEVLIILALVVPFYLLLKVVPEGE